MVILRSRWTRYSRIYREQFTKQSTDSLSDRNRVKIRLYLLQVMNLLVGQECIWMFMFSFIQKCFYVFQRLIQNFPNWVFKKVFRIHLRRKFSDLFSFQQNVAFRHFLIGRKAKSDNSYPVLHLKLSLWVCRCMICLFVVRFFSIQFRVFPIGRSWQECQNIPWHCEISSRAYFRVCFAFSWKWCLN